MSKVQKYIFIIKKKFPSRIDKLVFQLQWKYILIIKEIMSQAYSNLCQNINRYTLYELTNLKNTKFNSVLRHPSTQDKKSSSLIKVVSPFYQKSNCLKKGPCFCAFHRQKKKAEIFHNNLKKRNNTSKQNFVARSEELTKVRKFNTELTEKNLLSQKLIKASAQKMKKQINFSIDKYDSVLHKVHCRNQEFQSYLKKKQLYILTGKFPIKIKQEEESISDSQFLQNFYKDFENDQDFQEFLDFQRQKKKNKTDISYNYYKDKDTKYKRTPNHMDKSRQKFDCNEFLKKIKKIIESLIKGTSKMNLQKMKKLRDTFAKLLKKKKQSEKKQNEETQFLKNQQFLMYFDNFIVEFISKQEQNYLNIERPVHKSRRMSIKYVKNKRNQQIRQGVYKKKTTVRLSEKIKKQMMDFNLRQSNKQNEEPLNEANNVLKRMSKNKYETEIDERKHKNSSIEDERNEIEKDNLYKKLKKNYQEKYIRKVNLHIKTQNGISNFLQHDGNQQNFEESNLNYDQFYNKNSNQNRIKERLQKIKEIQENSNSEQILDKNYLKMRGHIEKNRKFILKMESRLRSLDLDLFIIEPTDSLIVRKKKIRYLQQILENNGYQKSRRNGFYDQIIQYLDIYKEHCNMIMKKDVKHKKMTNEDFFYQELQFEDITQEKDFTDSLKFINLHENEFSQKEKMIQGWISIPQYITNDQTRSKLQRIEGSLNKNNMMKKCEIISEESQDSLIQVELKDKFPVKKYLNCESAHKKRRNTKKLKSFRQKTQKSFQSIDQLKKRFGFDSLITN